MIDNPTTFRVFGPDETASNRLDPLLDVTDKQWNAEVLPSDDHLARSGRVMEMLSEHQCEGWLEGYLLTGRHGLFTSYEAFIHIVDSMLNQHAKWLSEASGVYWRRPISSLNYLLSSHVWQQDHNGLSHQDPGFIDHVVNKKARSGAGLSAVRREHTARHLRPLPALGELRECGCGGQESDIRLARHGCRDRPHDQGPRHLRMGGDGGAGAASRTSCWPCAGDVPTLETLAAASILRREVPELRVRVVNGVDLMRLQSAE